MKFFLHHFFHNETNDRSEQGKVYVPPDLSQWPKSWTTIEYKQYSLFQPIPLEKQEGVLWDKLLKPRRSTAESISGNNPTISVLTYVLKCGYGLQECSDSSRMENRTVPSGGKRYPLEVYLLLFQSMENLDPGVYHYGIRKHLLEPVILKEFSQQTKDSFSPVPCTGKAKGMFCITGVFDRTARKYGSRGYRYVLLEAGHVAQNMILAGTEKRMNMVPIGGINETAIERYMGLTTPDERVVYALYF